MKKPQLTRMLISRDAAGRGTTVAGLAATLVLAGHVLLGSAALSQLDDTCTVNIFNRSAQVRPDGSWRIDNLPANFGPVRARATCVADGVTVSGQSEFFDLVANIVNGFDAEIVLGAADPIPESLAVTAPSPVLSQAGATTQLTVTANFSDGTTSDVTGDLGTSYTISNAAIATLSPGGLVTAVASGTVLVSALREGVVGVASVAVQLSGDSDGDGIPDDLELSLGLDPNNPVDALEDADGDGLTNLEELVTFGTDINDPDSDGDGLDDGAEVNQFGTQPLLADTDGDGISDGLEVQSGSDPLDNTSFNLAGILESISVSPASFTLVFNTVVGEASRRLDVRAQLIDGSEIDIRSSTFGTNYLSSDLSVASFGAEDGRVFAGQDGTAVITVENNGFAATADVTVTTFSPAALAFLPLPGFANGVAVAGSFAYVASGATGLFVVDVTDLAAPSISGSVNTPGNANDVRSDGAFAFVADGPAGLQIVDVSNPGAPAVVGALDTAGIATDLVVSGDLVFVADGSAGVAVIDAGDRTAPVLLAILDTPGNARGIDVADDLLVVADASGGVHVIDATDPAAPVLAGSTHTRPNSFSRAADVAVRGRLAYVADGAGNLGGLRVVDFSLPTTPVVVGSTNDQFGLTGVALEGAFALTADYFFANAVPIFDVGGPQPQFSAALDFVGAPSFRDDNGNGVAAQNGAVFLVGTRFSIQDNGSFGDSGLHIGRYRLEQDDEGVPPEAVIVEPAAGAVVRERNPLVVRVDASDDIRVASVRFLVDGVAVFTDFGAPFELTFPVPTGVSSLTLGAVAVDLAGNEGVAENVAISVIPDDQPTVTLLAPVDGSSFAEGAVITLAAAASDDVAVASVEFLVDGASAGVSTAPPYQVSFQIPLNVAQLSIQAVATDSVGQTAVSNTAVIGVDDDPAPFVSVIQPVDGAGVVAGSQVQIVAGATDNGQVVRVRFFRNGSFVGDDFEAPFESVMVAPTVGATMTVMALAQDNVGQQTSASVTVVAVPDPGTTVQGTVLLPDLLPAVGAEVFVGALSDFTDFEGRFSIPGVPTIQHVVVRASLDVDGELLVGTSAPGVPVPDGITEVGEILLFPGFPNGNGGFETGDFIGWQVAGETNVLSALGPVLPPEGGFMGFLSTGGAAIGGTTSTLTTEPFTVPEGVNFLTFDFNFLSDEFPSFVGSIFNDTLVVRLTTAGGTDQDLLASVNTSSFVLSPGTGFNGMTGFAPVQLDVSAFAGSSSLCVVTFEVQVFDQGDTIVDSAGLIDNLRFE